MKNITKIVDFKRYSSIKIGPQLDVLIINEIGDYSEYQIIGRANNLLVSPNTTKKFAILGEEFDYIKQEGNLLYVGCATTSGKLLTYTRKNDIANLEFIAKLPGNLGGLVKMNAGLKSWEMFNYIHSIKTKDGYIKKEDVDYSYRRTKIDTIVYEVVFNIEYGFCKEKLKEFNKMRDNQPHMPSAGSCFKNPENDFAGRLIQEIGLKGYKKGDMSFSKEHANFLVNEVEEAVNKIVPVIKEKPAEKTYSKKEVDKLIKKTKIQTENRTKQIVKKELENTKIVEPTQVVYVKPRPDVIDEDAMLTKKLLDFIKIEYNDDKLIIYTDYKVSKKFTLDKENKIIIDYKAKMNFYTKRDDLESKNFMKIAVGNHKQEKYFRVVVELSDKPKNYKVSYTDNLITISRIN